MVEDEFLATAQSFTVHLHTAEYARQENLVKARKADTISSISRPVVGKMPDETRRKVEGVKRAERMEAVVGKLGAKGKGRVKEEDEESEGELPYYGTTLHGLMDSPRRRGAKLENLRGLNASKASRAAAGFKRPVGQMKALKREESPMSRVQVRMEQVAKVLDDSATESGEDEDDDEEDDLDAPVTYSRT